MKASEVLRRYAAGERDFCRANLRGQSFEGKNLAGADFSEADIRGANFTGANLTSAKFCGASAGLQRRWAIGLLIFSWLLSGLSGWFYGFAGSLGALIFNNTDPVIFSVGLLTSVLLTLFLTIAVNRGLAAGLGTLAIAAVVVIAVAVALTNFVFTFAFSIAGAAAGAVTIVVVAVAVAATGYVAGYIASFVAAAIAVTSTSSFISNQAVGDVVEELTEVSPSAFPWVSTAAVAVTLVGVYIGWSALRGDEKHAWIRPIAIAFAATGGTSFYKANLTEADFTLATLKSTDLRKATLIRTCWRDTIKLDHARPGETILADTAVRKLLVTGKGNNKSYANANLRGANLIGADLTYADLKQADISEATFQEACLEWANLTLTNAVSTNFTNAKMTGACLETWNIDSSTKLEDVDCQFVYLLEKPKHDKTDDRERRPSSGEFAPGEFTKLFEEVLNTVDLIFRDGVNWEAFIKAFDRVRDRVRVDNDGTELTVQSIENKGDNVFVIKVNVPPDADKEKIHSDITQNYDRELKAIEDEYRLQLNAKDTEIGIYRQYSAEIIELAKLAASRPIQNVIKNLQGDGNMSERTINTGGGNYNEKIKGDYVQGDKYDQSGNFGIGNMSGGTIEKGANVGGVINEAQPKNLAEVAAKIQDLLNYFEQNNPTIIEAQRMVKTATERQPELKNAKVIEEAIEATPTLKQRLSAAGSAAYVETVKMLLPPVGVAIEAVKAWNNPE